MAPQADATATKHVAPQMPRRLADLSWAKWQKPAKNKIEKSVKLTEPTCAINNLTCFEAHGMTGSGSYLNMLEFARKNL
jgi:hypothetical protein